MVEQENGRGSRTLAGPLVMLWATSLLLCGPVLLMAEEVHVIKSIQSVRNGVEIEVYSSRAFHGGALPMILRIGEREFSLSRFPEDGSLNTLLFFLTWDEFDQTRSGDSVAVYYGPGGTPNLTWDFGVLDKRLLAQSGTSIIAIKRITAAAGGGISSAQGTPEWYLPSGRRAELKNDNGAGMLPAIAVPGRGRGIAARLLTERWR